MINLKITKNILKNMSFFCTVCCSYSKKWRKKKCEQMSRNYFTSKNFKHLIWNSYIKTVLFIQGYFLEIFKTKSVWIFQLLYDGPAGGGSLYHKNHDRTLININICAHIHYPWSKKWQFFLKKPVITQSD